MQLSHRTSNQLKRQTLDCMVPPPIQAVIYFIYQPLRDYASLTNFSPSKVAIFLGLLAIQCNPQRPACRRLPNARCSKPLTPSQEWTPMQRSVAPLVPVPRRPNPVWGLGKQRLAFACLPERHFLIFTGSSRPCCELRVRSERADCSVVTTKAGKMEPQTSMATPRPLHASDSDCTSVWTA